MTIEIAKERAARHREWLIHASDDGDMPTTVYCLNLDVVEKLMKFFMRHNPPQEDSELPPEVLDTVRALFDGKPYAYGDWPE